MSIMSENLCANGHQELSLMADVTTFRDDLPVMHCNRCGENLGFEEAVRNDERVQIAKASVPVEIRLGSNSEVADHLVGILREIVRRDREEQP